MLHQDFLVRASAAVVGWNLDIVSGLPLGIWMAWSLLVGCGSESRCLPHSLAVDYYTFLRGLVAEFHHSCSDSQRQRLTRFVYRSLFVKRKNAACAPPSDNI